jgi:hypothetical protein
LNVVIYSLDISPHQRTKKKSIDQYFKNRLSAPQAMDVAAIFSDNSCLSQMKASPISPASPGLPGSSA